METSTTLKAMSRTRRAKVGHFLCEFDTPGIAYILKSAGCDFAMFDMEHSGFGFDTVKKVLRFMEAAALPCIVRVPSNAYDHIARACDMGAEGIVIPNVRTAAEARKIVDCVKYRPEGNRGVALQIAHDRYQPAPVGQALADANARTTFFPLIESEAGVENADAIAAVEGVDCLFVGHFDLSVSLGIPGEFDHPRFQAAMSEIVAAGRRHGKTLGRNVPNVEEGRRAFAEGFDFLTYSGDIWLYRSALADGVARLRGACVDMAGQAATGER